MLDKIILNPTDSVTCPHCDKQFAVKDGLSQGKVRIQPNKPVPPRARPPISIEAITLNAVSKLGMNSE